MLYALQLINIKYSVHFVSCYDDCLLLVADRDKGKNEGKEFEGSLS